MDYKVGECWCYRAPAGFEDSRIIIGAVVTFTGHEPIICCAVTGAPGRQGVAGEASSTIPFLPMTAGAFAQSVTTPDGAGEPPSGFQTGFDAWHEADDGHTFFTVPFEGLLDRMIALQMAQIVGTDVGAA